MEPKHRARALLALTESMQASMADLITIRSTLNRAVTAALLATPLAAIHAMPPDVRRQISHHIDDVLNPSAALELAQRWHPGRRFSPDEKKMIKRHLVPLVTRGAGAAVEPAPSPVAPAPAPARGRRRKAEEPAPTGDRTAPYSYTRKDGKVVTVAQGRKKPVRKAAETPENYLRRLMRWHLSR